MNLLALFFSVLACFFVAFNFSYIFAVRDLTCKSIISFSVFEQNSFSFFFVPFVFIFATFFFLFLFAGFFSLGFSFFAFFFPFVCSLCVFLCECGTSGYSQCERDDDVFHVDNIANSFRGFYG